MTKARDLASGAPAPAGVTTTELGFVDGVTSAIQTQVDGKAATSHNHDATYINQSTFDAKGDLIAATAADTPARLAAGANNTILVVDSTAATGLAWKSSSTLYNWTTYTPTNFGITIGNGNQVARYAKIGKTVFVAYRFILGSTSSLSGGIYVGLPSTANSTATCVVHIVDAGTNNYTGFGNVGGGESSLLLRGNRTDGTWGTWSNNLTDMFTFTTNDEIMFSLVYEEA